MRSGGSFGNCADFENGSAAADDDDDDTFKARMEKLSDKSSTNLYFEGLGFFSFFLSLCSSVWVWADWFCFFCRLPLSIDQPVCIPFARFVFRL